MSSLALAAALKDFGAGPPGAADPFAFVMPQEPAVADPSGFPDAAAEPAAAVDVEALIAEAVGEAQAQLAERLAQEHAQAMHAEQERHAEELAAIERRFGEEASETIATRFAELEEKVVGLTGAVAARILGGILTDDIRDRSLERLAGLVREALLDGEAARIRIHGSLPLFEALKRKLPERGDQLDFVERPQFDLSVSIDDSVYETRLAEWSGALAETLA